MSAARVLGRHSCSVTLTLEHRAHALPDTAAASCAQQLNPHSLVSSSRGGTWRKSGLVTSADFPSGERRLRHLSFDVRWFVSPRHEPEKQSSGRACKQQAGVTPRIPGSIGLGLGLGAQVLIDPPGTLRMTL